MTTTRTNPTQGMSAEQRLRALSPIACRLPPSGISVTEVLIAMGVLSIGLLGVAAIFPVGGHYMQRGEISDNADAIAQAALNDAITRGLLDPENWVAYEDTADQADLKMWDDFPPRGGNGAFGRYQRPFAADFRARLSTEANVVYGATTIPPQQLLNRVVGSSFVIDPYAIGVAVDTPVLADRYRADGLLAAFPAGVERNAEVVASATEDTFLSPEFGIHVFPNGTPPEWAPWEKVFGTTPIQRLTVRTRVANAGSALPVFSDEADRLTSSADDLALEIPEDADQPSQARFQLSAGTPLLRQARREYSWVLTVHPQTHESRLSLATGASGAFDVSAVVYHKRVVGDAPTDFNDVNDMNAAIQPLRLGERLVRARITNTGVGGGEVQFFKGLSPSSSISATKGSDFWWQDPLGDIDAPWEELRAGQWVYLFGAHPRSTVNRPQLFAQWYRVLAIDRTREDDTTHAFVAVSLRGPDWPWVENQRPNPSGNSTLLPNELSELLYAVIVPEVVAVHTRTLNLQSGAVWGQ